MMDDARASAPASELTRRPPGCGPVPSRRPGCVRPSASGRRSPGIRRETLLRRDDRPGRTSGRFAERNPDPRRGHCLSASRTEARLELLRERLEGEAARPVAIDASGEIFLGRVGNPPRIGFLFPGQGTAATRDGGAWGRRFPSLASIYRRAGLPVSGDLSSTEFAQPAIIAAELAALTVLRDLGIEAMTAVGHSLGELAALHWAGRSTAILC